MEAVLRFLLIRFGVILGVVVVLALVVFAGALMLRRQGRLGQARRRVGSVARDAVRLLDDHGSRSGDHAGDHAGDHVGDRSGSDRISGEVLRAAGRYLTDRQRSGGRR